MALSSQQGGIAQKPKPWSGAERSTWYMYFGDHPLTRSWGVHLEGQYRRQGIGQRWEQLLVRPGLIMTSVAASLRCLHTRISITTRLKGEASVIQRLPDLSLNIAFSKS